MPQPRTRWPTQSDVARLAEVSQPVVSYVLSGDPAAPVAPETRQRVLDAIERLGYIPDRRARGLRQQRTFTIAGVIPDITNPFYPAFERGVQDVAERRDYDLVTYNTDGIREKELKAVRAVRESRVDGVIITPFHLTAEELSDVVRDGIAVCINGIPGWDPIPLGMDQVANDSVAAAATAVNWLLELGHTRIGMIAGEEGTFPREARVRGYLQALADHDLPTDPILVRSVGFTVEGGRDAARELLALTPRPTAIFAANDLMAMGAMRQIREMGLRVPEDVAIVGFDDIPAASLVHPALTTIAQYPEQLGRRAAELIFERLDGNMGSPGRREDTPFDLVLRDSA